MAKVEGFKMPAIELGDVVFWFPGGSESADPHVAMVTKVGAETIHLNVFATNTYNLLLRDGVRHLTDPNAKRFETSENGAWDYTPRHKRLLKMEAQINALAEELGLKKGK